MATPFIAATQKKDLGPLSSADDVGGGGTPAAGQQFSDQKGSTDFVNADKLLSANAGKGQTMLDKAGQGQVDSTADFADLNAIKGYNPAAQLSTTQGSTSTTTQNSGKDANGQMQNWATTAVTPTTTTAYNGMTTDQVDAKKANIDALRSKFDGLSNQYSDSPSGVNLRQVAQQKSVASAVPTYSAQQGGFDSFLMENEGNKAGADGMSSIANRKASIDALRTKFDGIDDTTANLKTGIQSAQGQVGTVSSNPTSTNVYAAPNATGTPLEQTKTADGSTIVTDPNGSPIIYDKTGKIVPTSSGSKPRY